MKKSILVVFSLIILVLVAQAWYDKSHSLIVKMAIEIIKAKDKAQATGGKVPLYEELYDEDYTLRIGRGSWREDNDPGIAGNERSFRHYYDPDCDPNARAGKKGVKYYTHYLVWKLQGAPVKRPEGDYYFGALRWACDGGGEVTNPFHWKGAIDAYNYTRSSKFEAYRYIGHVAHLLGDMSEPDHSTNTPHPGSGKYYPDTLEELFFGSDEDEADDIVANIKGVVAKKKESLKMILLNYYTIGKERLYADLKKRFVGNVRCTGLEGVIEDCISPMRVSDYFFGGEKGVVEKKMRFRHLPDLRGEMIRGNDVKRYDEIPVEKMDKKYGLLAKYFDDLAGFSKAKQKESALKDKVFNLAVGCENLAPYLQGFAASTTVGSPQLSNFLLNQPLLHEPIYIIPVINEYDRKATEPILEFAKVLMREATMYVAGVFAHFHDIVNQPPYVMSVKVSQGKAEYRGWVEDEPMKMRISRKTEKYEDHVYHVFPNEYEIVKRRHFMQNVVGELYSGKRTSVRIIFGPDDGKYKERIDPKTVKVFIDGKRIDGSMTIENTWLGFFKPKIPDGATDKILKIRISAKDLHKHFPRKHRNKDLPTEGYELDSFPIAPAMPSSDFPYTWEFYEPGVDTQYSFRVDKGEEEEIDVLPWEWWLYTRGSYLDLYMGKKSEAEYTAKRKGGVVVDGPIFGQAGSRDAAFLEICKRISNPRLDDYGDMVGEYKGKTYKIGAIFMKNPDGSLRCRATKPPEREE